LSGCFRHASKEAVGSCHNCGELVCASCHKEIDGKSYCPVCVEKLFSPTEIKPKQTPSPLPVAAKPVPLTVVKDEVGAVPIAQAAKAVEPVSLPERPASELEKTGIIQPGVKQPSSNLWWLLPVFLAWIGGLAAWLVNRDKEPKKARYMLFGGLGMTVIQCGMALILILALCVPVNLKPSVSGGLPTTTINGPKESDPFTFSYESGDSDYAFYTDGDSIVTLMCSSPFYSGMQPLPGQKTGEYEAAWSKKVEELNQESQKIVQAVNRVKPQVATMRSAYLSYLSVCFENEKMLKGFVSGTVADMVRLSVEEQVVEAQYLSFGQYEPINAFFDSYQNYIQVTKAVELGSLYLEDTNNMLADAAVSMRILENHPSSQIKTASSQLDADFKALDPMCADLAVIASSIEKIGYGLKQLETGNYYLARSADSFIKDSLPDMKNKVDSITPNEYFTQEDIDMTRDYLALFELWQSSLRERLDGVDKSSLIKISYAQPAEGGFFSPVYAADEVSSYTQAFLALAPPAQGSVDQSAGFFSKGWSAVKSAVHGAQNLVGAAVDYEGENVFRLSRIYFGWEQGNTLKEVCDDIRINNEELNANYRRGLAGSEAFKTADEYFTNVEEWAGSKVESGTQKIEKGIASVGSKDIGSKDETGPQKMPYLSKGLGTIAKLTVGLYTGLGHGVSKLSNVNSTKGDYVSGLIDVVGAFFGGSKVICKASQIPGASKGLANMGKTLIEKFSLWLKKKQASPGWWDGYNSKNIWQDFPLKEKYLSSLDAQQARLTAELKKGATTGLKTSYATGKESFLSLFIDNSSLHETLLTRLRQFKETLGKDSLDILDNIIGQGVDEFLKQLAKTSIDDGLTTAAAGLPSVQISPRSIRCNVGDTVHLAAECHNLPDDVSLPVKYEWTFMNNSRVLAKGQGKELDGSFDDPGTWEVTVDADARDSAGSPIRGADGGMLLHDTITALVSMPKVDITVEPSDILQNKGDATKKYVFLAKPENIPDGATYTWNINGQKILQGVDKIQAIILPNTFKAEEPYTMTVAVTWKEDLPGGYIGQVDRRATKSISFTIASAEPTLFIQMPGDGKVLQPDKENIFYAVPTGIPGDAVYEWYINEGLLKEQGKDGTVVTTPAGFFKDGDYEMRVIARWKDADLKEQLAQADAKFKVAKISISLSIIPPPEIESKSAQENTKYYFALNTNIPSTGTFTWYSDGQEVGKGQSIGLAFSAGQHIVELKANWQDTDAANTKREQKAIPLSFNIVATQPLDDSGSGWYMVKVEPEVNETPLHTQQYPLYTAMNVKCTESSCVKNCCDPDCNDIFHVSFTWTNMPKYLKPNEKYQITFTQTGDTVNCKLGPDLIFVFVGDLLWQSRQLKGVKAGTYTITIPPHTKQNNNFLIAVMAGGTVKYYYEYR